MVSKQIKIGLVAVFSMLIVGATYFYFGFDWDDRTRSRGRTAVVWAQPSGPPLEQPPGPPLEQPPAYVPTISTDIVKSIKEDFAIAILTTAGLQGQRLKWIFDTWAKGFEDIVTVISDIDGDALSDGRTIPNYVNSKCSSNYRTGLPCKDEFMHAMWKTEPFKKKKWFFRAGDDTYIHLENLWHYTNSQDPEIPKVVGERWCWNNLEYTTGGPGILFSAAWARSFDPKLWADVPNKIHSTLDDLVYGGYYRESRVPLTHHHGFSQTKADYDNNLYLEMTKSKQWKFTFRPIAFHQAGASHKMPEVHALLHAINYTDIDPKPYPETPNCMCLDAGNHRCTTDNALIHDYMCQQGAKSTHCLYKSGDWPQ